MAVPTCWFVVATLLVLGAGGLGSGGPGLARGAQPEASGQDVTVAFGGDVLLGEDVTPTRATDREPASPTFQNCERPISPSSTSRRMVGPGADALDT